MKQNLILMKKKNVWFTKSNITQLNVPELFLFEKPYIKPAISTKKNREKGFLERCIEIQ